MSTPYQRGAAFERRVQSELEAEGWLVTRSPASKSPYDLVALRRREGLRPEPGHNGQDLLIQCKLRGSISRREIEVLCELAWAYGAEAVLAYTLQERGVIHYRMYEPDDGCARAWHP